MKQINESDLKWALLDIFEDDATLDQEAVRDAFKAAVTLTSEECKSALLLALDHVRKARA